MAKRQYYKLLYESLSAHFDQTFDQKNAEKVRIRDNDNAHFYIGQQLLVS